MKVVISGGFIFRFGFLHLCWGFETNLFEHLFHLARRVHVEWHYDRRFERVGQRFDIFLGLVVEVGHRKLGAERSERLGASPGNGILIRNAYNARESAYLAAIAVTALWASGAHAERRVALVIGNGAYKNAPRLPNPTNDAQDVAASLKRNGFDTIVGIDLDRAGMDEAAIRFSRAARDADVAMFYYSGHAMQMAR